EAVEWSWELLTKVYGIPQDRLYATYFRGEPSMGLEPDEETRQLWLRFLPPERVLPGNMKDNFWEMGDTGPCGPCTEIHVDRIGGRDAAPMVNAGDPDVIEIWNNVFIQFERLADGSLRNLPAKHVDTGLGLERLVSILQGVRSNYDTDVFSPIFARIEQLTGARPYMGRLGAADKDNIDTAYRVIADHIRTLTFAITDGAVPSNIGRGYVLRRILRRAVRYGRQMLGAKSGFFAQLVPVVVDRFGGAFPELRKDPARVAAVILEEEESFGRTLDRGIKLFEEVASKSAGVIGGADAFKLYDTFGFPIDLTVLMAQERGMTVDMEGYEAQRARAEELSRAGASKDGPGQLALSGEEIARLKRLNIDPTEDGHKFDARELSATVRAIWNGHNFDEHAKAGMAHVGKQVGIITDRTAFYSTMGGQECDTGRITVLKGARSGAAMHGEFIVDRVAVFGGYVLHVGHVAHGEISVGDRVALDIDKLRRAQTAANHTATHLANLGLRAVLGGAVDQKGSLVARDRFRFDFSHTQPVSPEELARVEAIVGEQVKRNLTVYAEPAPLHVAKGVNTLRAVFGETYPDPVRVVSIGVPVQKLLDSPGKPEWMDYSVEFCGGTHVESTSLIGEFAVIAEEAVAKGVRRITAVTGQPAAQAIAAADELAREIDAGEALPDADLAKAAQALGVKIDGATLPVSRKAQLRARLAALQERAKAASKQLGAAVRDTAVKQARSLAESALMANDAVVVGTVEAGDNREALLAALKTIRDKCPRASVMLMSVDEAGKVAVAAAVTPADNAKGLKAGDWVREACTIMGGKGGGKPDSAMGGGADASKVREAITAARTGALRLVMS
ncbi:MAG: alanine--tRNA ligase, partial [Phycisphaeraceae bacterium]|nr:alanine--tRNA ligase [Phycisphaeraceae bacterium]